MPWLVWLIAYGQSFGRNRIALLLVVDIANMCPGRLTWGWAVHRYARMQESLGRRHDSFLLHCKAQAAHLPVRPFGGPRELLPPLGCN